MNSKTIDLKTVNIYTFVPIFFHEFDGSTRERIEDLYEGIKLEKSI
jgi:hypothetical protein